MARDVQDHFFRQAKRDGYLSRAAYKLLQINEKRPLLRKGQCVLDCGCAPGSWLQVCASIVGPKGCVVGIDLKPIEHRFPETHVHVMTGDLVQTPASELLAPMQKLLGQDKGRPAHLRLFDTVLSDMAPSTTGDRNVDHHGSVRLCQAVLNRCGDLLPPGGSLVMKVFEGGDYPDLLAQVKARFDKTRGFRPAASRSESTEMFIIAEGFQPRADDRAESEHHAAVTKPPPGPPAGWGAGG